MEEEISEDESQSQGSEDDDDPSYADPAIATVHGRSVSNAGE